MIIGFDLQALQTEQSRNRGIGRAAENSLNKILELDSTNIFKLFLNNLYKENADLEPNKKNEIIKVHYNDPQSSNNTINEIIQFLRYGKENLDILQIFSAFEGYPSQLPVISPYLNRLDSIICTTIHDFIPLYFPEHYLATRESLISYYKRLKTVYDSDLLFSVSESTRIDAVNLLGINPKKIITVGGGVADMFHKIENLTTKEIEKLKKKYDIKEKFILFTGGIDFRKNIERSITAFSKIGNNLLASTSYVIVCQINEIDRRRLIDLASKCGIKENLILTGYLSDSELNILYNCCDLFIFPSLIEGFGLPILEAMKCDAPVIGSNGSSIGELIEEDEFMFDPLNEEEITSIIKKILTDAEFKNKSISHSIRRAKDFSWLKTAEKMLSTYNSLPEKILEKKSKNNLYKPKIAFFSPLPPKKSGISNYSTTLLRRLSKYWDIDIFIDDYDCSDIFVIANFNIYPYAEFEKMNKFAKYDSILYQVGNSDNHIYMFDFIKKYPGVVVLHDVFLGGVMYWATARIGKLNEFIDEVVYSHGDYGKSLVEKAKKNLIPWDKLVWELQVNKRILEKATQIIVHSKWDKENITNLYPEFNDKITLANQFAPIRIAVNKCRNKESLGFSKDDFLICSFGFVVSTKKIDSVIKNLKSFLEKHQNCKYVIVGDFSDTYGQTIKNLVNELGLSNKVIFSGFIDEVTYKKYLEICDVCISLRTNARAGTSASISHALGAGLPTIISDDGPFSEFPSDVVIKIKPNEEKNLSKIMDDLYTNPQMLRTLSDKARYHAENDLSLDFCVAKYVEVVDKTILKNKELIV